MASQIRTAIVLGAGASRGDNLPMQSELFRHFWQSAASGPQGSFRPAHADAFKEFVKNPLEAFFSSFFGISGAQLTAKDTVFPSFEEALGILDLSFAAAEEFADLDAEDARQMRQSLIDLIVVGLSGTHDLAANHHSTLVRNLHKCRLLESTVFVSLNYDLLIDRALTDVLGEARIDYGVRFRNTKGTATSARPAVGLFKLHGSLAWALCPACRALDNNLDEVTALRQVPGAFAGTPFGCCGNRYQVVLITPAFLKSLNAPVMQQVWTATEQALKTVETLVFAGYSFPDADLNFKYMLKRIQLLKSNSLLPQMRQIVVLNHHSDKGEIQARDEMSRYRRFFGGGVHVVSPTLGFADLAADPLAVLRDAESSAPRS